MNLSDKYESKDTSAPLVEDLSQISSSQCLKSKPENGAFMKNGKKRDLSKQDEIDKNNISSVSGAVIRSHELKSESQQPDFHNGSKTEHKPKPQRESSKVIKCGRTKETEKRQDNEIGASQGASENLSEPDFKVLAELFESCSLNDEEEVADNKERNYPFQDSNTAFTSMGELHVDVTDCSDPQYWDIKFASNLVDYVVRFYYDRFGIIPRWNHSNYDHLPDNPNAVFDLDDADYVLSVLLSNRKLYEELFHNLIDPKSPVCQSAFDGAVEVVLRENMRQYFIPMTAYQLATAIAVFGILSCQRGFPDALYHAVYSIVTNVKILRNHTPNTCSDLLTVAPRVIPAYRYVTRQGPAFRPVTIENVTEHGE